MLASPTLIDPTSARRRSTSTCLEKVTRIIWPPTKSTPRFSPRTATSDRLATVRTTDSRRPTFRQRMKSMFVLSGTSFRSFIAASDVKHAGPLASHPQGDEHPREIDGREDRGDDADHKHDREAADRPGSEVPHEHRGDDVRDVCVEDRGRGFPVARLDGVERLSSAPLLLAYSLVDQHVRIDRRADRQDEARNS